MLGPTRAVQPCRGGGASDVGIGSQDDVFQAEMEQFPSHKAEGHVHHHHQEAEHEQQRRVPEDFQDGSGHPDGEEEQVDEIGADFLGSGQGCRLFFKKGGEPHGKQGDPHILAAEEGIGHVSQAAAGGNGGPQGLPQVLGQGHHRHRIEQVQGNVL